MIKYFKIVMTRFKEILLDKFHKSALSTNYSSIFLENCIARLWGGVNVKFSYIKNDNIFCATEGLRQTKFSNKVRGFCLYRNGITNRAEFLFHSYCLKNIDFFEDDVVIDCGANYGDLTYKLANYIKPSNYIAIEPNPYDFKILKLNTNNESTLINKALGNINGKLPFYISTEEADSSIIKPKVFTEVCDVSVVRLDKLIEELNINKIKLLKIEAEGYELEILEGLGRAIEKCQYIAIDGGYESGINCEQTLTVTTNYLLNNGFEMKDIYFPWYRALFLRKEK